MSSRSRKLLMGGIGGTSSSGGGGGGVTWDPLNKTVLCVLSGGDLTASSSPGDANGGVRATVSHSATGKYYYEVLVNAIAGSNKPAIGVCTSSYGLGSPGYHVPDVWGVVTNGVVLNPALLFGNGAGGSAGINLAAGDVWAVAVDLATGRIWWAKNNTWRGGGDPAAGTSPSFSSVAGTIFPFVNVANGTSITARFTAVSWTYSAPAGFGEW